MSRHTLHGASDLSYILSDDGKIILNSAESVFCQSIKMDSIGLNIIERRRDIRQRRSDE